MQDCSTSSLNVAWLSVRVQGWTHRPSGSLQASVPKAMLSGNTGIFYFLLPEVHKCDVSS